MYYIPTHIYRKIFHIFYYFSGLLFCIFRKFERSPESQYSITILRLLSSIKDSLYLTIKGWISFPMMVASLTALVYKQIHFFLLFHWVYLSWFAWVHIFIWLICLMLCISLRSFLIQVLFEFQNCLYDFSL